MKRSFKECVEFEVCVHLLGLEALLDQVQLVAERLVAVRHADLGHVGLADVVALGTLLQVVVSQEVNLLLAP